MIKRRLIERFLLSLLTFIKKNPVFIISLISLIFYVKVIGFGYTQLDDSSLIRTRFQYLSDIGNIFHSFGRSAFYMVASNSSYYRPLLTVSFILDTALFRENLAGFHITNVILHILAVTVLYYFLLALKFSSKSSLVGSILFATHPVLGQAVAWIPGRNDTLLTIFTLTSFMYLTKYVNNYKKKNLFFFFLFWSFAVFTKESSIILLPLFLYYMKVIKKIHLASLPSGLFFALFAPVVAFFILRHIVVGSMNIEWLKLFIQALGVSPFGYLVYLGKVLFPVNLTVLPTLASSTIVYGAASFIMFFLLLKLSRKRRAKIVFFGLLWFFLILFLSFLKVEKNAPFIFLEHRLYLPLVGLLVVLMETDLFKAFVASRRVGLLVVVIIAVFFGISARYLEYFKDPISFWSKAVQDSPDFIGAKVNLGLSYALNKEYEEARNIFEEITTQTNYSDMAYNNLGMIAAETEDMAQAELYFKRSIEINPNNWRGYLNLGLLYKKVGDLEKSEEMFLKSLVANPDNVDAQMNLAKIYVDRGDFNKAQYYYQETLKRGVRY